ncbi:hypothetical protein D0B54_09270 [Solimonas sp. K1W22B-7]|uniref:hypothetical protein n=1 Tax=Solimonas sp. K1W22B-7 TaxID=2303331 RepID=UPI000E330DBC|nr:hypothetical protein [Solimonas sp. K1W22B-7]AXQ28860.1 hypothetical protein D0B54_09270 [Solimonas sp. K1W22B-7]
MKRTIALLALLLAACASGPTKEQLLSFTPGQAVPVDLAMPNLPNLVGKRITLSGLPRQREGSCLGMPPMSNNDWMLTGDSECLWVNGRAPGAAILDVRNNNSNVPLAVTGKLVRTREGVLVLMAEAAPPRTVPVAAPPPQPIAPPPQPVPPPEEAAPAPLPEPPPAPAPY